MTGPPPEPSVRRCWAGVALAAIAIVAGSYAVVLVDLAIGWLR